MKHRWCACGFAPSEKEFDEMLVRRDLLGRGQPGRPSRQEDPALPGMTRRVSRRRRLLRRPARERARERTRKPAGRPATLGPASGAAPDRVATRCRSRYMILQHFFCRTGTRLTGKCSRRIREICTNDQHPLRNTAHACLYIRQYCTAQRRPNRGNGRWSFFRQKASPRDKP